MIRSLLPLVMALVVGCGAPTPPPAAAPAPAGPSAAEKAAELGYKVSWPAEPSFARSAFTSAFGMVDSEDATAVGPGMVRYGVGVQKYPDNAVFAKPPREALGEVLKQFEKLLVNTKSADREFGPKKLPAVEQTGEAAVGRPIRSRPVHRIGDGRHTGPRVRAGRGRLPQLVRADPVNPDGLPGVQSGG